MKPREYYLNPKGTWIKVTPLVEQDKLSSEVHVIEYSAVEKLREENQRLVLLLADADKYADDLLQANKRQRKWFDENQSLTQTLREACAALEHMKNNAYGSACESDPTIFQVAFEDAKDTLSSIYAKFPELAKIQTALGS